MSKITASNINKKIKEITDMIDFNTKTVKKQEIFDSEEEQQLPVKSGLQIHSNQIKLQHTQAKSSIEIKKLNNQKRQFKKKVNQEQQEYNYEENDQEISTFSADTDEEEQSFEDKESKKRGSSTNKHRKIRTTITHEKLMEMNKIFKEYKDMRQAGIIDKSINLRAICSQLQLGYSTILHKYRQFRHNSEVKGGALLSSRQLRRKYKKSVQIEEHIRQAIKQTNLTNAVQISKYIYKSKKIYYSRAVICRHLAAVKNERSNSKVIQQKKKQQVQIENHSVQTREESQKRDLGIEQMFNRVLNQVRNNNQKIIYLHEVVYDELSQENENCKRAQINREVLPISLYLAVFDNKIIVKKMKNGLLLSQDYIEFLEKIGQWRSKNLPILKGKLYLLTNPNQVHYDNFQQVRRVIQKYSFIKLPAPLLFQNPLQQMLLTIKQRVLQKQKETSHKYLIESNIMSWRMRSSFKYQLN